MKRHFDEMEQRFSIRKYSLGAASVLVGVTLFGGQTVAADQLETTENRLFSHYVDEEGVEDLAYADQVVESYVRRNAKTEFVFPAATKFESVSPKEESKPSSSKLVESSQPETKAQVDQPQSESRTTNLNPAANQDQDSRENSNPVSPAISQPAVNELNLPDNGSYTLPSQAAVKAEPKADAATLFHFEEGENIGYEKALQADGYHWLTYIAFSGARHYVQLSPVSKISEKVDVPKENEGSKPVVEPEKTDKAVGSDLKAPGRYNFEQTTDIKAEPKKSSPVVAYYPAGQSVHYDQVLEADGLQWISYLSYKGNRYYIPVGEVKQETISESSPAAEHPVNPQLPASGVYRFTERGDIRNEPKLSAKSDYYYAAGESVRYDRLLENEGRQWISYISYNGTRRYIAVAESKSAQPIQPEIPKVASEVKPSLPASGTYNFVSRASIKAEPKVASPELAYYDKGMSVNYDRVLTADGYDWISYLSTAGNRRYIAISESQKVAKSEEAAKPVTSKVDDSKPSLPASGRYTFTASAGIKNEPSITAPDLYTYDKGMSVTYDKVLVKDGQEWLSYVSYSGIRRYVAIGAAKENPQPVSQSKSDLAPSGRYTFKENRPLYSQPDASLTSNRYYPAGQSVYYDKVLVKDGHEWLSYLSFAGERLYVLIK